MPTFTRTLKVTYDANGGSGAPSASTHTEAITPSSYPASISSSVTLAPASSNPTRSGHRFLGWSTSSSASSSTYSPGATVARTWMIQSSSDPTTGTITIQLYAVWSKITYTVSYSASGASNVPSSQTKQYGTALTLSSKVPTKAGATFKNWNTNASGTGTSYSPGGTYTANSNVTLYAQWTTVTYTVTYNAGAGDGAPAQQTKTHGVNLALSSVKPTRSGYAFISWNTKSDASGTTYQPGATYSTNANMTLYAVWHKLAAVTLTASDSYITTAHTINITKQESSDVVKVSLKISDGIVQQIYSGTASSFNWDVSSYGSYFPTSYSWTATLLIDTYVGNTLIGTREKQYPLKVPEYTLPNPTVTLSEAETSLSDFSTFIQGKSRIRTVISASSSYGATITAISSDINGEKVSGATFTTKRLTVSDQQVCKVNITDSRGNTVIYSKSFYVSAYADPSAAITAKRASGDSTRINISCSYNIASIDSQNTKTYAVKYKAQTDSSYTTIASGTLPSYSGTNTSYVTGLEAGSAYNVLFELADKFGTISYSKIVPADGMVFIRGSATDKTLHFPKHTIIEASYEIAEGAWKKYISLDSSSNLNDLVIPGSYRCAGNSTAEAITNSPTAYAFTMEVYNALGEQTGNRTAPSGNLHRTQIVSDYLGNSYKRRITIASDGGIAFTSWVQDAFSGGTTAESLFSSSPTLSSITAYNSRADFSGGYCTYGKLVVVQTVANILTNGMQGGTNYRISNAIPKPAVDVALSVAVNGNSMSGMFVSTQVTTNGYIYVEAPEHIPSGVNISMTGVYMSV